MNIHKNVIMHCTAELNVKTGTHLSSCWTVKMPSHLVRGHLYLHLTRSHHNSVPPMPTCLVNLVWCILSPRYRLQSSTTLCSANYAILSAEVPPKLSFCYDQTLSQSENVPAIPTCHHHSNHTIIWWKANI